MRRTLVITETGGGQDFWPGHLLRRSHTPKPYSEGHPGFYSAADGREKATWASDKEKATQDFRAGRRHEEKRMKVGSVSELGFSADEAAGSRLIESSTQA